MTRTCDVAVIGAGPAGATLAALLASRGMSVTLLDRDDFPRDKVCGEFLSYDALPFLERIGVSEEIDELGATEINTCRIVGASRSFEFELPVAARGISRVSLDALLVRNATASGASVIEQASVDSVDRNSEGWTIGFTDRDLGRHSLQAKVAVGAWGRWGRIDRQLGRSFVHDHSRRYFGFKRHYATSSRSASIDLYSFGSGYLGVAAIERGATNICGLVHERRLKETKGGWEPLVASFANESRPLRELFASHRPLQDDFLSTDPVIFAAKEPVADSMLLIGDASGLVDPLAGNGMAMGIQSAFLAAPFVARALAGENIAAQYAEAHRSTFRERIRWSRRAAWILSRPRLLDRALVAARPAIGEFLLRRTRAGSSSIERLLFP